MKHFIGKINPSLQLTCTWDSYDSNRHQFIYKRLDIFDHWLSEEEANQLMLSYPVLQNKKADMTKYFEKESLLVSFMNFLYTHHEILLCKAVNHFRFSSAQEFRDLCIKSLREEEFSYFHIPELELSIYGSFDLSFGFIFSKPYLGISVLESYLKKFPGTYLLE